MSPAKTEVVQKTELAAGLALGTLKLGVDAITSSKMSIEFAFEHVWLQWPPHRMYPQIRHGLKQPDIYMGVIVFSERRRHAFARWESKGAHLLPYVSDETWTVDEALDSLAETSGVGRDQWIDLAQSFLSELEGHEKFAYEPPASGS